LLQKASLGLSTVSNIQTPLYPVVFSRLSIIFDRPCADSIPKATGTFAAVILVLIGIKGRWDSLKSISGEKRPRLHAEEYQGNGRGYQ